MGETKTWTFKVEDIFKDIEGDNKNVEMKIPDEVAEAAGIQPGDTIRVLWGDQGTVKIEKVEKEDSGEKQAKE